MIKSSKEWGGEIDVSLFGIVLAHSLLGFPGVPLTSGLESGKKTWLLDGVVSDGALLEESVDLSLLLVSEGWLLVSELLSDFFEG